MKDLELCDWDQIIEQFENLREHAEKVISYGFPLVSYLKRKMGDAEFRYACKYTYGIVDSLYVKMIHLTMRYECYIPEGHEKSSSIKAEFTNFREVRGCLGELRALLESVIYG